MGDDAERLTWIGHATVLGHLRRHGAVRAFAREGSALEQAVAVRVLAPGESLALERLAA